MRNVLKVNRRSFVTEKNNGCSIGKPTARKWSFLLRITLVNVKKLVGDCRLNVNFVSQYLFYRNIIFTLLFPMFPFDSLATKRANENDFLFPWNLGSYPPYIPKWHLFQLLILPFQKCEMNKTVVIFFFIKQIRLTW